MTTHRQSRSGQPIAYPSYPVEGRIPSQHTSQRFSNQIHPTTRPATHTCNLFALIIGINGYVNSRALHGAVADAESMKRFLMKYIGVFEDHIRTLLDYQASREAIIQAFRDLKNDPRIKRGDPIIIFYAGHGGESRAPACWGIQGNVQCIIPHDYRSANKDPIPDRTIAALINDIAEVKGTNITLIFDCCYSASCARFDFSQEYVPRSVDLDFELAKDLDNDIWGGRAGEIPESFAHTGIRSHVLLAACGEKELAFEHERRGQFTRALLATLKNCVIKDITYAEIIERISVDKQSPHCIGANQHHLLFAAEQPVCRQLRYPIVFNQGKCIISAGLAHGVSWGVEFTLYNNRSGVLAVIVADPRWNVDIREFSTIFGISEARFGGASTAKLTRVGKVNFNLSLERPFSPETPRQTLQRLVGSSILAPNLQIDERHPQAKLEISVGRRQISFKILDQFVRSFGLTRLPYNVTVDTVSHVLRAAAHYYWYLHIMHRESQLVTQRKIAIHFHPLQRTYDELALPIYTPVSRGSRRTNCLDVIDFVVDPNTVYGIEITNKTDRDLYLNAFLFNSSSLSIAPYYVQSSASRNPDAPLKKNGTFTIGYGATGTDPFKYSLNDGQDIDVGYLKLFFATRAVDLTDIVQRSPFKEPAPRPKGDSREGWSVTETRGANDTWFTMVVPVIQRRWQPSVTR